jgi:hypothetical protein
MDLPVMSDETPEPGKVKSWDFTCVDGQPQIVLWIEGGGHFRLSLTTGQLWLASTRINKILHALCVV